MYANSLAAEKRQAAERRHHLEAARRRDRRRRASARPSSTCSSCCWRWPATRPPATPPSHGMRALLDNPDQFAKLKANPELLAGAIEEILRWATPVLHFRRTAMRGLRARRQADQGRATRSSCGTSRPTATRRCSTTRSASTSSAPPTSTSPSAAAAPTSASAPTWPAWSCGLIFTEILDRLPGHAARRRDRVPALELHRRHQAHAGRVHARRANPPLTRDSSTANGGTTSRPVEPGPENASPGEPAGLSIGYAPSDQRSRGTTPNAGSEPRQEPSHRSVGRPSHAGRSGSSLCTTMSARSVGRTVSSSAVGKAGTGCGSVARPRCGSEQRLVADPGASQGLLERGGHEDAQVPPVDQLRAQEEHAIEEKHGDRRLPS